MAYGRYRRGRYAPRDFGKEAALRHIGEAKAFSRDVGGTDVDVKDYFFDLSSSERDRIFGAYGYFYGNQAEEYARNTFQKWKDGSTRMSGLRRATSVQSPSAPDADCAKT